MMSAYKAQSMLNHADMASSRRSICTFVDLEDGDRSMMGYTINNYRIFNEAFGL